MNIEYEILDTTKFDDKNARFQADIKEVSENNEKTKIGEFDISVNYEKNSDQILLRMLSEFTETASFAHENFNLIVLPVRMVTDIMTVVSAIYSRYHDQIPETVKPLAAHAVQQASSLLNIYEEKKEIFERSQGPDNKKPEQQN